MLTKTNTINVDSAQASIDGVLTKIIGLKKRAEVLHQQKLSAKAELDVLKKQYESLRVQIQKFGIDDTKNIPQHLEELKNELLNSIKTLELSISQMEHGNDNIS